MIKPIWTIAKNTFIETVRERILYAVIGFSLLAIAGSLLAGSVSLGQDIRVIQSFGLNAMLVFLLAITLLTGSQMMHRETEQKTIYLTLTKPVNREIFYLGKFVGLCLVVAAAAGLMGSVYVLLLWAKAGFVGVSNFWAISFMILEGWLVVALGMLFGSFTASIAGAIYSFALVLIGHSTLTLKTIGAKSPAVVRYLLDGVYYIFPNLEKFNLRNEVVYNLSPNTTQILSTVAYFAGFTAVLLLLGLAVFRKNEF